MSKRVAVAVLCGGPSSEREVSLASGRNIAKALDKNKYAACIIEIPKDRGEILKLFAAPKTFVDIDLALIALHGTFGEDGVVQNLLDLRGIAYTGSGPVTSALGMDKVITMTVARASGLRVPEFFTVQKHSNILENVGMLVRKKFGYPCVVKPNASGSSVGVAIVRRGRDLEKALRNAFAEGDTAIVQRYIKGRELTCGVLGNAGEDLLALPPIEIVAGNEFFDYNAKYASKKTRELCPAPVRPSVRENVKRASRRIHETLGCDGLTRSDFILAPGGKLYFLEINTIPGMTPASLCPKEAAALGWSFGEFLDKIIALAMEKTRI